MWCIASDDEDDGLAIANLEKMQLNFVVKRRARNPTCNYNCTINPESRKNAVPLVNFSLFPCPIN